MSFQPGLRALTQGFDEGLRIIRGINRSTTASFETLWSTGGQYPWPTAALPLRVRAGGDPLDGNPGPGAQTVFVRGLDDEGNLIQDVLVLSGAAESSPTSQSFFRINLAVVVGVGTYGGTNIGTVVIEHTDGTQLSEIEPGQGQANVGVFSVPLGTALLVSDVRICGSGNSAMLIESEVRTRGEILATTSGMRSFAGRLGGFARAASWEQTFGNFVAIVPPLTDVEMRVLLLNGAADGTLTGRLLELYKEESCD